MIEPFCSVYTKSYRSFDREPELEATRSCAYFKDLGENFLPLEDSKTIYNPERDESVIKELHLKRLISTYQQSYCVSEGKRSMVIDPDNLEEDQFMVYFNKYYAPRKGAVPRPLETARRINGYSRFDYYYTGRSTLEDSIYREAYEYFKKDYDKGKSRLFAKKQREMHEARRKAKGEDREEAEERIEGKKVEGEVEAEVRKEQPQKESSKEKICQICCPNVLPRSPQNRRRHLIRVGKHKLIQHLVRKFISTVFPFSPVDNRKGNQKKIRIQKRVKSGGRKTKEKGQNEIGQKHKKKVVEMAKRAKRQEEGRLRER